MGAFLTPIGGGYLADRFIGTRRSLVIGGIIIASGHFVLALDTMVTFYIGLLLVVIGTGFFKPNVSTMVGQLYRPGDPRRDAGFTIFYMGINLGALFAPLVCGFLAQSETTRALAVRAGLSPNRTWSWGFAAAGVGMLIGLALYVWLRDRFLPGIGLSAPGAPAPRESGKPAPGAEKLTRDEWRRVIALLVMFVFVLFFWAVYEQAGSSLNLFADRYVDLRVGSWTMPSSWFQSVQPICVVLLGPIFAYLWRRLRDVNREPSTQVKMALGLLLLGVGCVFLVIAGRTVDACVGSHAARQCAVSSPAWLTLFYLFSVFGELCLSPVGLSYVTKVAPVRFVAFMMGAWFLTNSFGSKLAGMLAALGSQLPSQVQFFTILLGISLTAGAVLLFFVPWLKRLTQGTGA
jgi:POT family proton-dependent oligopeptide transporter